MKKILMIMFLLCLCIMCIVPRSMAMEETKEARLKVLENYILKLNQEIKNKTNNRMETIGAYKELSRIINIEKRNEELTTKAEEAAEVYRVEQGANDKILKALEGEDNEIEKIEEHTENGSTGA